MDTATSDKKTLSFQPLRPPEGTVAKMASEARARAVSRLPGGMTRKAAKAASVKARLSGLSRIMLGMLCLMAACAVNEKTRAPDSFPFVVDYAKNAGWDFQFGLGWSNAGLTKLGD